MSRQLGTGHIHSLTGGALACAALSGYVSPNMQTLRATHSADREAIKGQTGKTTGLILEDDVIECQVEVVPEGTTVANAKLSAGLPAAGTAFTMSGLPIIAMGGFADVFNDAGTNPWIYEGGGSLNGMAAGKWTLTMTLKRYPQIASGTAVT